MLIVSRASHKIDDLMKLKKHSNPVVFMYGLYSRCGRFYSPYSFSPDVNYSEFVQNVYSELRKGGCNEFVFKNN